VPDVFLSYSREDQSIARRFADALEREGFSVWWDQALRSGDAYDKVTEQALREAKAVVVLWSRHSVESRWVRAEATTADRNGTLVPVMVEDCTRPVMFELTHTADLSGWKGDTSVPAWRAYVEDIRRFVRGESEAHAPGPQTRMPAPHSRRRIVAVASGLLALVGLGAVLMQFLPLSGSTSTARGTGAQSAIVLGVLPFRNLTGDADLDPFVEEIPREVRGQLAGTAGITVLGSAFESAQGAGTSPATHLLQGEFRSEGGVLRTHAELTALDTNAVLWAQSYPGTIEDMLAAQSSIGAQVAGALKVKFDVGESSRRNGGTTDPEAFSKYLRARAEHFKSSQQGFLEAAVLCKEALAIDGNFSKAWYELFLVSSNVDPRGEEARVALQKLESLSPDAWWTDVARTAAALSEWDWSKADAASSRALAALAPDKDATAFRATFLARVGRMREAVSLWYRAASNDKLSLIDSMNLQAALTAVGAFDAAEREYQRSLTLEGNSLESLFMALTRAVLAEPRDRERIDKAFRDLLAHQTGDSLSRFVHENFDRPALVRARLKQAFGSPASSSLQIAFFADWFDDSQLALAALRRAFVDEGITVTSLLWEPFRSDARSRPEFKELIRHAGLFDYWRTSGNWGDFCQAAGADDFTCK